MKEKGYFGHCCLLRTDKSTVLVTQALRQQEQFKNNQKM